MMTQEQEDKVELVSQVKSAIIEFNKLIDKANELKVKIDVVQKFHPAMNMNGAPINPRLSVNASEVVVY